MAGHFGGNPYKWDPGANSPHISRYFLARGWIEPGETVFDAACATGYGSHMMSKVAGKVIGYEIDTGCIEYANRDWKSDNTEFHVKDLNTCEIPEADVSVSIETIEHLTPKGMIHFTQELMKKMRRLIIVTVPLGGTTWAYKDEPPGPATEKNDFMTGAVMDKLFDVPEWNKFSDFEYGYSYFAVYFRKNPKR